MSDTPFSVRGKKVVVVGAARSGVAAAELLVRRGASVTLTDVRDRIEDEERLRAAGVALPRARRAPCVDVFSSQSGRAQSRRAVSTARRRGGAARGCAGHRRARAGLAVVARPDRRHHGHQREVDDDDADRPDAGSRWLPRPGRRQHRTGVERPGRSVDRRNHPRNRGEQLSAGERADLPAVDRGAAELLARSPRPARDRRGIRRSQGAHLCQAAADDWPPSTPTIPAHSSSPRPRAPTDCCSR